MIEKFYLTKIWYTTTRSTQTGSVNVNEQVLYISQSFRIGISQNIHFLNLYRNTAGIFYCQLGYMYMK